GPTPNRNGEVIGSCGPTTSSRMDKFTPLLYKSGISVTIGKGERSKEVIEAIKKYKGAYLMTWGGCGAYLRKFVKESSVLAFPEFGAEAVRELVVQDFPAVVAIDSCGRTIF
ncbi:MAG: fumarate hydratase C-terminal domain-containing protein, partial [Candidatus Saelkia tenebricola]|nr:fumarate hydratase C-terminal domain-containing protein [Candidatus Saelkia tenebricola]